MIQYSRGGGGGGGGVELKMKVFSWYEAEATRSDME